MDLPITTQLKTKLTILGVVLVLLTGGYIWWLNHTNSKQAEQIASLTSENQVLTQNNKVLQDSLSTQNAALDKLSTTFDSTKQDFSNLTHAVNQQSATVSTALSNIKTSKKPTTCEDTIQYLIDAVKDYQK